MRAAAAAGSDRAFFRIANGSAFATCQHNGSNGYMSDWLFAPPLYRSQGLKVSLSAFNRRINRRDNRNVLIAQSDLRNRDIERGG